MSEQSREITRESEVDHYVDAERILLTVFLRIRYMPTNTCYADNIFTTECTRGAVLLNVD